MRISHIRIENYRNLRHVDVELGNIIALIGENNSGKSNFLRALSIPLSPENTGSMKQLSWFDINNEAKKQYYEFLRSNRVSIIDGSLSVDAFKSHIPTVTIQLDITPEENEHYDVKDILIDEEQWIGGILYRYYVKNPQELLNLVQGILVKEVEDDDIQMSLLPTELYDYSITVPGKGNKISYDIISRFRTVELPAERDNFASSADRLGSKALSDLLQKQLTSDSRVKIEKAYRGFFDTVKTEGELDAVLNWQQYSDIQNAQDFFKQISVLPNMPQISSILGGIRLGYKDDNMFSQGLGYRNLILIAILLNSYLNKGHDISFRLMTIEEPEAHLCISNVLLMTSLINIFSQKNKYTQIVYSTHNVEFVNKVGLDKVVVLHNGNAIALKSELSETQQKYFAANPNTDIFKLLYSKKTILVEGITEELLIKAYLQTRIDLSDIKVLSFHKGFKDIIDIWKKVNAGSGNKLGVVRDYDDEPKAQRDHENKQDDNVIVRTTTGYTLETDITNANFALLVEKYGDAYGWDGLNADELQRAWRNKKSDVMLTICRDLINGEIDGFTMPQHIQQIIDFMQGDNHES